MVLGEGWATTKQLLVVWGSVLLGIGAICDTIAGDTNDRDAFPLGDTDCGVVDVVASGMHLIDVQPGDLFWLTVSGAEGQAGVTVDLDNGDYETVIYTGDRLPVEYPVAGTYIIHCGVDGRKLHPIRVRVLAPPDDAKLPKEKKPAKDSGDSLAATLSDPPAFSVSVGSVYAGQYSGVGKFPIRMVANGAGTFTLTRYGGPVVGHGYSEARENNGTCSMARHLPPTGP